MFTFQKECLAIQMVNFKNIRAKMERILNILTRICYFIKHIYYQISSYSEFSNFIINYLHMCM